jgi:hypothetical protein
MRIRRTLCLRCIRNCFRPLRRSVITCETGFRHYQPCYKVSKNCRHKRNGKDNGQHPKKPDDRRIHLKIFGYAAAYAGDLAIHHRSHQPPGQPRRTNGRHILTRTAEIAEIRIIGDLSLTLRANHVVSSNNRLLRSLRRKSSIAFESATMFNLRLQQTKLRCVDALNCMSSLTPSFVFMWVWASAHTCRLKPAPTCASEMLIRLENPVRDETT